MNESPGTIVYRLNAKGEIVFVNAEWDRFAAANDGASAMSGRVLNRPLWDFIADSTTQSLYRLIVARAADDRPVRFPLRCDSPTRRRLLEMSVSRTADRGVEFCTRLLQEEHRPAMALLDAAALRSAEMLRMCSWCEKIDLGGTWEEVEVAAARLQLFNQPVLPAITHGMCQPCFGRMMSSLGQS